MGLVPQLDAVDRRLLNLVQADFPLVEQPFLALGERLGVSEEEVIQRLGRLKEDHILRQISAIFDTRSLGYKSSLVAARIPPERLDEAAAIINEHPGVSHNYKRNHVYNLWFTIAVPPNSHLGLEKTVEVLGRTSGAEVVRLMPTLKLFKIGVNLDMTGEEPIIRQAEEKTCYSDSSRPTNSHLTDGEIRLIRELQKDLPLIPRPFDPLAEAAATTTARLLAAAKTFIERGQMRRFSAVLLHRQAGFKSNAMGVWAVPEDRTDEVGCQMAGFAAVSHCYLRPTYEDWPYNIFSLVHGRSKAECEEVLSAIQAETGIAERAALHSSKEYKKTRVHYFTPDCEEWERRHIPSRSPSSSDTCCRTSDV